MSETGPTRPRSVRQRLALVLGAVGLVLLGGTWGLATPPGASPDEPAHIYYAWAVVTGQALGDDVRPSPENPMHILVDGVDAVGDMVEPGCYAFREDQPVSTCALAVPDGTDEASTYMTRYPVSYYLPAGAWLFLTEGPATEGSLLPLVLLRVLSGAVAGAVVATAAMVLLRRYSLTAVLPVVVLAMTPTAWSLSGAVNPNGLEVALAVLLGALVLATRHDLLRQGRVGPGLAAALPLVTLLLANSRPVSFAWAALLLAALLLPVRGGDHRARPAFLRLPWWSTGTVLLAGAVSFVWFLWAAELRGDEWETDPDAPWYSLGVGWRVLLVQMRFGQVLDDAIGTFGWVDTPLPELAVFAWVAVVVLVVVRWFDGGQVPEMPRWVPAVVVLLGLVVVSVQSLASAFGWQGRYYLPFLAGALVLCTAGLDRSLRGSGRARSSVLFASASAWTLQVVSLVWALARHAYGTSETLYRFDRLPLPSLSSGGDWVPLGGVSTVVGLALAALVIGLVVHVLAWRSPAPSGPGVTHGPVDPAAHDHVAGPGGSTRPASGSRSEVG